MTHRLSGLAMVAVLASCSPDPEIQTNPDGPAPAACVEDTSVDSRSSALLGSGEPAVGHVCPVGDADFFAFSVPAGSDLVGIELGNDVPLTSIDLSYSLIDADGKTAIGGAGDADGSDGTTAISHHHRVPRGREIFVLVRDGGDDEQDVRNPYTLAVTGAVDPDPNEPNDSVATAARPVGALGGTIAFLGDVDVYALDLTAPALLDLSLSADAIAIGLRLAWLDPAGEVLREFEAPTPAAVEAGVGELLGVPTTGTYYLAVSAWDGVSEDFDTPYSLGTSSVAEPDPHESPARNDSAASATPLFGGAPYDGTGTAADPILDGRIASGGDQDWYVLQTDVAAVIDLTLNGPPALEWSASLIAPDPDTACTQDAECVELTQPCGADWECLSSTCAGTSGGVCPGGDVCFCQGAGICLPESVCGVPQFSRTATGGAALFTSQPLFAPGRYYIRVVDQGGDEWSLDPYSMVVGLRTDPDSAEPDNDYDPYPLTNTPAEPSLCDTGGGPCLATTLAMGATAVGHLAYESDFDYLRLDLPCCATACPCGNTADVCSLQIEFGADAGPVDFVWELFAGSAGGAAYWGGFDLSVIPDGVLGDDECFVYSRFVDIPGGDAVYVRVRDDVTDGAEWHATQSYFVRLAGAAPGCPSGCTMECTDFCGAPCTGPDTPPACCDHDPAGIPPSCAADGGALDGGAPDGPLDGPAGDL